MANWKHASLIGVVFAVVLAGTGVGMYYLGFGNGQEKAISRPNIFQMLQDEISAEQIDISLKHLSSVPHLAGTPQDLEQAEWVRDRFLEAGLDETKIVPYEVLLSYPKKESPNKVYLLTEKGTQIFATSGTQPPLYAEEESSEDVLPNFNAYSAPGNVTADLVYVFFGREQDYEQLAARGVNVSGKIVLARYGAIFRGNIVSIAEKMGAVGAILYSDPQNYAQDGRTAVYNHSFWMPGLGVQSGSLFRTASPGDPLTPLYPSLSSAHRLDQLEADLPKIPVQPIGYNEAEIFLREMSKTNRAPDEWQGTLDTVYYMGPGFQTPGYKVKMEVHTSNQKAIIHNTIGILYGEEEPGDTRMAVICETLDRYVLVGNHRDAWTLGSIDPSSGTASMLEMARAFGVMKTNLNWRPRRSLVFCSWGAEEYALIGSYEWVEQHAKVLSQRAVAYLNVDIAVAGNQSLRARASPLLRTVLVESAKKVPNPNPTEVALGRNTVHDTWAFNFPDAQHPGEAKVDNLGSGSDHAAFMYSVGIPSMDFNYAYKPVCSFFLKLPVIED